MVTGVFEYDCPSCVLVSLGLCLSFLPSSRFPHPPQLFTLRGVCVYPYPCFPPISSHLCPLTPSLDFET